MKAKSVWSIAAMLIMFFSAGSPAYADEIDRTRCKIDGLFDSLGNPFNHVQIQVKVDTESTQPVTIWVTNAFGTMSSVFSGYAVGGTATGEWDSSPDVLTADVLLIDSGFAEADEEITAAATVGGVPVATMTVTCKVKTSGVFRQDTKRCKQKDFDRGRCSPVTEP